MRVQFVILMLMTALSADAGGDFSRYQKILQRMPFGEEPSPEALAAAAKPAALQESFTRNLKMCAVTRNLLNGDLQVGIMNVVTKKSYFLCVGECEDEITVVDVDYNGERALIRKGDEEAWLGMSDAVTVARAPAAGTPQVAKVASANVNSSAPAAPKVLRADRLKPKLTGEALTKHLEQYQMDLIRAGGEKGPPLPLELTPEMDEQLVKEGILPPQ